MIIWYLAGILQYGSRGHGPFTYFFLSPGLLSLSSRQSILASGIMISLVLHEKGYRAKFADGRRRLRTFTKRKSVR